MKYQANGIAESANLRVYKYIPGTVVINKYTMKVINMCNANLYSYKSEILQIQLF